MDIILVLRKISLGTAISVLLALTTNLFAAEMTRDTERELFNLINNVKLEADVERREENAENLLRYVVRMNDAALDSVDGKMLDALADLLRDSSDVVKSFAADSLGQFEGRASRELPALRQALAESRSKKGLPMILPTRNSIGSIEAAIHFIEHPSRTR